MASARNRLRAKDAVIVIGAMGAVLGVDGLWGFLALRMVVPLIEVQHFFGGYWFLAAGAGFAVAVGVPVLCWRGFRSDKVTSSWPLGLLLGYVLAVAVGFAAFYGVHVNTDVAVQPVISRVPLSFLLELAALAFVSSGLVTGVLLVLLIPVVLCRRRWRARHGAPARPKRHPGVRLTRMPVRLRPEGPGRQGKWLRGMLTAKPGSLIWEPAAGVSAMPVELTRATLIPGEAARGWFRLSNSGRAIRVATPTAQVQLQITANLFELSQALAGIAASGVSPPNSPAGAGNAGLLRHPDRA